MMLLDSLPPSSDVHWASCHTVWLFRSGSRRSIGLMQPTTLVNWLYQLQDDYASALDHHHYPSLATFT